MLEVISRQKAAAYGFAAKWRLWGQKFAFATGRIAA
jgi:hypothetical protein